MCKNFIFVSFRLLFFDAASKKNVFESARLECLNNQELETTRDPEMIQFLYTFWTFTVRILKYFFSTPNNYTIVDFLLKSYFISCKNSHQQDEIFEWHTKLIEDIYTPSLQLNLYNILNFIVTIFRSRSK